MRRKLVRQILVILYEKDYYEQVLYHAPFVQTARPLKILFLSANPADTARLRLDEELRELQGCMREFADRGRVHLRCQTALRPKKIPEYLIDYEPDIIHVSGHGVANGTSCAVMLESDSGYSEFLDIQELAAFAGYLEYPARCLVVTACLSAMSARLAASHIACVVGVSAALPDQSAIQFTVTFYRALASGQPVERAYRMARKAVQMMRLPYDDAFVLETMEGVDAARLRLLPEHGSPKLNASRTKMKMILEGSFDEESKEELLRYIRGRLRGISGDARLTVEEIYEGSIIVEFTCSRAAADRLVEAHEIGNLGQAIGMRVVHIDGVECIDEVKRSGPATVSAAVSSHVGPRWSSLLRGVAFVILGMAISWSVLHAPDSPDPFTRGEFLSNPPAPASPEAAAQAPPAPTVESLDSKTDNDAQLIRFDHHVRRAEQAIVEEEWKAALDALGQATSLPLDDAERRAHAASLREYAEAELNNAANFQRVRTAVAMDRFDELVEYYALLPEESIYRRRAAPAYQKIVSEWLDDKYAQSRQLLKQRNCGRLKKLADEVGRYFAEQRKDFEEFISACTRMRRRKKREERSLLGIIEAENLQDEARASYRRGHYVASLKACQKARQATQAKLAAAGICGLAACKLGDATRAEVYLRIADKGARKAILQVCMQYDINLQQVEPTPDSRDAQPNHSADPFEKTE